MAPQAESLAPPLSATIWRGRSGRNYRLVAESLADFSLDDGALRVIAKGPLALWVGTAGDLVTDPHCRSRFRLALDCADRIYRLADRSDEVTRLTTIWDLEGAEPEDTRHAA